jgi:hypothetical protein
MSETWSAFMTKNDSDIAQQPTASLVGPLENGRLVCCVASRDPHQLPVFHFSASPSISYEPAHTHCFHTRLTPEPCHTSHQSHCSVCASQKKNVVPPALTFSDATHTWDLVFKCHHTPVMPTDIHTHPTGHTVGKLPLSCHTVHGPMHVLLL